MSSTNGPKSSTKSGCSVIHLYISKSATFTLNFKLFLTGEAFHYAHQQIMITTMFQNLRIPAYAVEEQK